MLPKTQSGAEIPPNPSRFLMIGLCFTGTIIAYSERTGFSISINKMAEHSGLDKASMGGVLSAFYWGYAFTQVPGGWLSQKFGPQRVLAASYIIWAIAALLTPSRLTSSWEMTWMWIARLVVGISQGVIFPSIHTMLAQWVPINEKSRAVSLSTSGMYLGAACTMVIMPLLIEAFGVASERRFVATMSLAWVTAWQWFGADTRRQKHLSTHGGGGMGLSATAAASTGFVPWRELLTSPAVWAIVLSNYSFHYAFYMIHGWLPNYFEQALGARLKDNLGASMLPYFTMFICSNLGGIIADFMIERKVSVGTTRKFINTSGFVATALALLEIPSAQTATGCSFFASIALGSGAIARGGFSVNHMDIGAQYAGVLMGISNTAGTVAGIMGNSMTGLILGFFGSDNWYPVFVTPAVLCIVAAITFVAFAKGEPLFR